MRFDVEFVLLYTGQRQLALLAGLPHVSTLNKEALVACQVGDLLYVGDAILVVVRRKWRLGAGRAALLIFVELKIYRRTREGAPRQETAP